MTKFELDIDGYRKKLFDYIVLSLSHELNLGKSWMEREDVIYHAKGHYIDICEALINGRFLRVREKYFDHPSQQSKLNITG